MRAFKNALTALLFGVSLSLSASSWAAATAADASAETPETKIHPVRGFLPDLKFNLVGPGNTAVSQADYLGKVVLMFFGYSSCPDICPTTMAQLSQVMHLLGPEADKVKILFVSVDPHRDTSEKLQAYVQAFDNHAIGLTGTEKQVADVARRYRVAYEIEKPKAESPDNYQVAHSRGVYIFDAHGKAVLLASDSERVQALADSVKPLLAKAQ